MFVCGAWVHTQSGSWPEIWCWVQHAPWASWHRRQKKLRAELLVAPETKVNNINPLGKKKKTVGGKVYYGSRSKPNITQCSNWYQPLSPGVHCTCTTLLVQDVLNSGQRKAESRLQSHPPRPCLPLLLSIRPTMQMCCSIYLLRRTEKVINFSNSGPCALHTGKVHPEKVSLTFSHVDRTLLSCT